MARRKNRHRRLARVWCYEGKKVIVQLAKRLVVAIGQYLDFRSRLVVKSLYKNDVHCAQRRDDLIQRERTIAIAKQGAIGWRYKNDAQGAGLPMSPTISSLGID